MIRSLFLAAALLAASTTAAATRYNFDYVASGGDAVGITRAFDDGTNTVIAFLNPVEALQPTVTAADGTILRYRAVDNYAVLPGIQRHVLIYSRGMAAQVRYVPPHATHYRPPSHFVTVPARTPAPPPAVDPARHAPLVDVSDSTPALTTPAPAAAAPPAQPATPAASTPRPAVATPVAATAALATTVVEPLQPTWTAANGSSLRSAVESWADDAGWTVVWDAQVDYSVTGTLTYRGDFLDATRQIFRAYASADKPLNPAAYPRQKVLHVTE